MAMHSPSTSEVPDTKDEGDAERAAAKAAERIYRVWSEPEEGNLIAGVSTLGVGNWEAIRVDPAYNLTQRSALQLKDKWRNLVKYKHVAPEDFPTYADVCRRRRTEALLALAPKIHFQHHGANLQNFDTASSFSEKRKRPRASSPEPSSSFNDSQTSRHENLQSKIRHEAESARSGPMLSPGVSQALKKVTIAKEFVREALLIQRDANALASKAMAATTVSGGDQIQIQETIRSANMIASLAQGKSLKSRSFLEDALDNLSRAEKAAAIVQLLPKTARADADDTAHSSCKSPGHKRGSPEDCGTSAEVPALAGSSGMPERVSETMEHEVQDYSHKDDAAFSNDHIFDKYGLDEWVSLVLDEAGSELSDADALHHGTQGFISNCEDFHFHH